MHNQGQWKLHRLQTCVDDATEKQEQTHSTFEPLVWKLVDTNLRGLPAHSTVAIYAGDVLQFVKKAFGLIGMPKNTIWVTI
jgi:hypothetical protein